MVATQALDDPLLALGHDAHPLEDGNQYKCGKGADDDEAGHAANVLFSKESGPNDPGSIAFDGDEAHALAGGDVTVGDAGPLLVAEDRLLEAHAAFLEL